MPQDYVTRKRKKESLTDKYIPETIEKEYARSKNLEKSESFPREYLPQFQTDYVKRDAYIPQQPAQAAPVIPDFAAKLAADAGAAGLPQVPTVVQPQAEQPQTIQGGQQGPLTSETDILKGQLAGVEAEPEQRAKFAPEQLGQPPVEQSPTGQPPSDEEGGVPWGDILLGATPTLIGYLFGGAEGAGLGAEIGGKALMDEAGRRQKKADEAEQGIKATEAKTAERAADYEYWEKKQRATKEIAEPYEIAKEERALTKTEKEYTLKGDLAERKAESAADIERRQKAHFDKTGRTMKPRDLENLKFKNQKALKDHTEKLKKSEVATGGFSKDNLRTVRQGRGELIAYNKQQRNVVDTMESFMNSVGAELSQADRTAIMKYAKASQGTGVLTENDVKMFQNIGGVYAWVIGKKSEWEAGKLSPSARATYKRAAILMHRHAAKAHNQNIDKYVDSTSNLISGQRDKVASVYSPFRKNVYGADLIEFDRIARLKKHTPEVAEKIKKIQKFRGYLETGTDDQKRRMINMIDEIRSSYDK